LDSLPSDIIGVTQAAHADLGKHTEGGARKDHKQVLGVPTISGSGESGTIKLS